MSGAAIGAREVDGFVPDDWATAAQAAIAAGQYALHPDGDGFTATNRAQDLHIAFAGGGVRVGTRDGAGEDIGLSLAGWGRDGATIPVSAGALAEGPCRGDGAADPFGACLRRLHNLRPGLVEWWENRSEGLELGFTVSEPTPGEGALVFDLIVEGATVEVEAGGDALFHAGRDLRFAGLVAWDSVGRSLPAHMEGTDQGLRLVVDDSDAVGAVTVDPLLTTANWTVESNQVSAELGWSASSAGDVNGDGFGDVAVGARAYDNGSLDEGALFVYLGSAAGLGTTAAWTAEGDQAGARFGNDVGSAGDVNGDGYGDLVVGSSLYDGGSTDEGRAFLYLGSATGLATTSAWTAESDQASAQFGTTVASAGDVNRDGYGDVLVGAVDYDNPSVDEGRVWLYLGSASGLSAAPAWTNESNQTRAYYGHALGSAGDVNGDGYGDVAIAARHYTNGQSQEGMVFVYLGSASGLGTTAVHGTADIRPAPLFFDRFKLECPPALARHVFVIFRHIADERNFRMVDVVYFDSEWDSRGFKDMRNSLFARVYRKFHFGGVEAYSDSFCDVSKQFAIGFPAILVPYDFFEQEICVELVGIKESSGNRKNARRIGVRFFCALKFVLVELLHIDHPSEIIQIL